MDGVDWAAIGAAGWAAIACAAVALLAGIADRRRRRRTDPDRVGMVDWPTVQVIALIGLAIAAALAFT